MVPDLVYDNHPIEQPYLPEEGYHLSRDLADRAIEFIKDSKTVAPDKPWFTYFCPGCAHAPHHVFKEWADRYKGRFDMGYEEIREQILANQKKMGLVPESTELSPINPHGEPEATGPDGQPWPRLDFVRPWDSLSEDEQRLFIRMAEVFAGFVSYTDHEIGRILDYLQESGQLENTIVIVVSDNGASGEGGPNGTFNEMKFFNNVPDDVKTNLLHLDELGSPKSYNHYCNGWAWAFDTPFPYWKRFAGYEGGTADMCVVAWPKGIPAGGEMRHQVHPCRRHRADPVRDARHRAPGGPEGVHPEPDRRGELRPGSLAIRGRPKRRSSSTRCSGSEPSTTRAGWRIPSTRPSPGGRSSSTTSGSSTT